MQFRFFFLQSETLVLSFRIADEMHGGTRQTPFNYTSHILRILVCKM